MLLFFPLLSYLSWAYFFGECLTLIDEDETDGEWAQTRLHSLAGLGAHHLKILQLDSTRSSRCSIRLRHRRPSARLKNRPQVLISINYVQVSAPVGGAYLFTSRLQINWYLIVAAIVFFMLNSNKHRGEFRMVTELCRKILRFVPWFWQCAAVRTAPPSGSVCLFNFINLSR